MSIQPMGYPDWQAQPGWRSGNNFAALVTHIAPGVLAGEAFPVFNWAAVMVRVAPFEGGCKVTVRWWLDAAKTLAVGADTWAVTVATSLFVVIPCEASFVSVDINNTGAAAINAQTYLAGTNAAANKPSYPLTGNVTAANAVSVAASGSASYRAAWINRGRGHLHLDPADTAGKLNFKLVTEDETGAQLAELITAPAITAPADFEFPWPDQIVALHITNTDAAAAHTYTIAMWSAAE